MLKFLSMPTGDNKTQNPNIHHVNGVEEFQKQVIEASEPYVFVDFWAPWCTPCIMMNPSLEEVANKLNSQVKVVKVNVDDNQELAAKYNIFSIPNMFLFKGKNEAGERESSSVLGFRPQPVLFQWLQEQGVDTDAVAEDKTSTEAEINVSLPKAA